MSEIKFLVGIDWGSCNHQAAIVDINGTPLGNRSFKHGGTGLDRRPVSHTRRSQERGRPGREIA